MDPSLPPTTHDQPDVWIAHLRQWPHERMRELLTPQEEARRQRFHREADSQRFATGRALLRLAFARRLQCAPGDVAIVIEPGGRPRLAALHPQFAFSIAHSGALVVLAVAAREDQAIGVDVEFDTHVDDLDALVPQVCSADEAARLASGTPAQRRHRFLRLWTLKEAFLKATGEGLARDPRSVAFAGEQDATARLVDGPAGWQFALAQPGPEAGHVIALALHGLPAQLHPRFLDGAVLLETAP